MAVSRAGLSEGDFFTSLGMLIIQGRKWDAFRRTRGRGLHCPTVRNSSPPHHQCSPTNVECQTALSFRNAIQLIWQCGGSVVIDVILLPDCGHQETSLLLEKWLLQPTNEDSTMPELSLMQAIDSTIHFSQLCSWWSSTNGCQPRNIQYKVYESQESDLKFAEPAINHNFMVSNGVKVRLQYLPRQKNIPELHCVCCYPNTGSQQQMDVGSPSRGRSFVHRGPRRGSRHSSASSDSLSPSVSRVDMSPYGSPILSPLQRTSLSSSSSSRGSSRTVSPCVSRSPSEHSVIMAFEAHRLMQESERPATENSSSTVSRNDSGFMDLTSRDSITINQDEELANQLDSLSDSDLSDDYVIDGPVGSPGLVGTSIASPDDARVQMLQSTYAGWHCRHPAFDRLMGETTGTRDRTRHSSLDSAVSNLERLDLRTRRQLSRTNSDGKDFADLRVNCSNDCEKDFFISDIKKRHKLKSPNQTETDDTQHCSQNNTFYASFRTNPKNSDPILDFCGSADDFSSNFTGFEFSQHHLNSTPTTIGFVTMTRPVSLNLPETPPHFANSEDLKTSQPTVPRNLDPFTLENSRSKRKVFEEALDTSTSSLINEEKLKHDCRVDETPIPVYKSSRQQFQGKVAQCNKKCENLSITTSENFTRQIGKPVQDEDCQRNNKEEDSVATSSSCSILLRSPPSKLRILPSHCVDKNYLHNPPRQPIHKISSATQHGTARKLQFNPLPEKSVCTSPAPIRRNNSVRFEFDEDMPKLNQRSSRSMCRGKCMKKNGIIVNNHTHTQRLLGSFEESIIHNRLEVLGSVEGFHAQLGASGSFCPSKVKLPVPVKFFHVSDDNAPSPYMGTMSVKGRECGKRGYHIPRKGTIQLTLFNPNNSVVKVFVILYDVSDMSPGHRTFLRHRIFSKPTSNKLDHNGNVVKTEEANTPRENISTNSKYLRYFINIWLESSKTNKVYIHGDVKILFSLASNEWDSGNTYELQSETEFPKNPKYSPKR